jgi:hypothetical protein
MTIEQTKSFVRQHFDDFVNKQDLSAADRNFSPDYQEHGSDAPPNSLPVPPAPSNISLKPSNASPTFT